MFKSCRGLLNPFIIMSLNIENLVRSGVVLAIGVPLVLGLNGTLGTLGRLAEETDAKDDAVAALKADLAVPCLKYVMSKADSKLERQSKDEIEEVLGGEVNHNETCKYVLR